MEREGWELLRLAAQRLLAVLKGVEPEEGVLVDPRELAVMLECARADVQGSWGLVDALLKARAEASEVERAKAGHWVRPGK